MRLDSMRDALYNRLNMEEHLPQTFAALSDPTRLAILERLRAGEASAGTLAEPFELTQPAVSRHLRTLQQAGLITQRRDGTRRMFRLAPHRLTEIEAWLEPYRKALEASYSKLDDLLTGKDPE